MMKGVGVATNTGCIEIQPQNIIIEEEENLSKKIAFIKMPIDKEKELPFGLAQPSTNSFLAGNNTNYL